LSSRPKRSAAERSEVLLRTQGDENASVQQALPTNRRPLLVIPSKASDLQFRGLYWKCFRQSAAYGEVCGSSAAPKVTKNASVQ
jgi:hypothetical protein